MNSKYILCILLSLLFFNIQAQNFPIDEGTKKITYIKTIDVAPLTPSEIYDAAKDWGEKEGLTIVSDETNKKIVFNGTFKVLYRPAKASTNEEGDVSYKLHIGVKNGKYRYILVDLKHKGPSGEGGKLEEPKPECGTTSITNNSWVKIKLATHRHASNLIEKLEVAMKVVQNNPTKSDDW